MKIKNIFNALNKGYEAFKASFVAALKENAQDISTLVLNPTVFSTKIEPMETRSMKTQRSVAARATRELESAHLYAPSELMPQKQDFVHLVGSFSAQGSTDVVLDGKKVDFSTLEHRPADTKKGISEAFLLRTRNNECDTTYVFWNNPDVVQRRNQLDKVPGIETTVHDRHYAVDSSEQVSISSGGFIISEKPALPVLTDVVDLPTVTTSSSNESQWGGLQETASRLQKTVAEGRADLAERSRKFNFK